MNFGLKTKEYKEWEIDEVEVIRNRFLEVEEELGRPLATEEIVYHCWFWKQHLEAGRKNLRFDDMFQNFYSHSNKKTPYKLEKKILGKDRSIPISVKVNASRIISKKTKNLADIADQFKSHPQIQDILKQDIPIVFQENHSSWINGPMSNIIGDKFLGISKKNRFTTLGPALTTENQYLSAISSQSNLLKCVPLTQRGNVPGIDDVISKINKGFTKRVMSCLVSGNIVFYFPSGTTDKYDKKTGKISMVRPNDNALGFMSLMNRRAAIVNVGMNDRELFAGNSKLNSGNVYTKIGNIYMPKELKDPEEALINLSQCILDETGSQVGGVIDPEKNSSIDHTAFLTFLKNFLPLEEINNLV